MKTDKCSNLRISEVWPVKMNERRKMTDYTPEQLLEYLTKYYDVSDGEFGIEVDNNDRGYISANGIRADAVRFYSENKMPDIGFTRIEDVKYNGRTYRCYVKFTCIRELLE